MTNHTDNHMNIESLIRDLILEDQFKEKYTKRQRSIFCKNMYSKISTFLKNRDTLLRETNAQLDKISAKLDETEKKFENYKTAYNYLLKSSYKVVILDMIYSMTTFGIILYFYYTLYSYFIKTMQTDQWQIPQQIM